MKIPFASYLAYLLHNLKRYGQKRNSSIPSFRGASSAKPERSNLPFEQFVGDDLDAETGQSLVVVHRRGQMTDRGNAEIAQDLRTDADLAPLPVAVGLRGL